MDNYKIKVKDEAESKEAQELFVQLGYELDPFFENYEPNTKWVLACTDGSMGCASDGMAKDKLKELTLPQLRDLVVLKRNDVKDATHKDGHFPNVGWYQNSLGGFHQDDVKTNKWSGEYPTTYVEACNLKPIQTVQVVLNNLEELREEYKDYHQDQGLISGAEALRALADSLSVEVKRIHDSEWQPAQIFGVSVFTDSETTSFRLKPQTIKLELEIPKPFEPKEGDTFYYLNDGEECGYVKCEHDWTFDPKDLNFGAWRTEEEVKQVVEQLRKLRGNNS
ncbi:hypothetical protein [Acinetobacter lactucae]|uniref:hypothetical protein n=1 Tax=Acinetobacter lactucae TaxID=1785128 RepID=UPI0003DF85C3|nr:hypothetical protein [Acinetobacter lactucae]ETR94615.1 putative aB1gp47 [Acinetobacter lactucae]